MSGKETVSTSKILMAETKSVVVESMEEKESPTKPPRNDGWVSPVPVVESHPTDPSVSVVKAHPTDTIPVASSPDIISKVPKNVGSKIEIPHESGLQKFIEERLELPSEVIARTLTPGEKVEASFEIYFPRVNRTIVHILYWTIFTLGIYPFYLCYLGLRACIARMKCCCCPCQPDEVEFHRGKLFVTNKKRVIVWSNDYKQTKTCCGSNRPYEIGHSKKIFGTSELREISQIINSPPFCGGILCCLPCLASCCQFIGMIKFDTGIRLSFREFDPLPDPSGLVLPVGTFSSAIKFVFGIFRNGAVPNEMGDTFVITSSDQDIVNGRTFSTDANQTVKQICILHKEVIKCLNVAECFQAPANPDTEKTNIIVPDLNGVTLVSVKGKLKVPSQWFPLLKGENILDSKGLVYRLDLYDW
eukprot:CAMPEP_0119046580 /NCGR_PEP_ID=MMETSP1177-20130426/47581_1 /TAXON_ID=2985 /ORGANISM="Ochromonas sp, Strain CCMP1899" /LENGTH=415 /DNA_ID=CAMNT_0007019927 /DNA_START=106 /DNA_END=1350 /DNA_ORIENTATION=-